jgi:predicted nuclease of predicted toxin-antitoxin system
MNILLDQSVPVPLRHAFYSDDSVETVHERGWSSLSNNELIAVAEAAGFDALITTDWNTSDQHIQAGRTLSVVGLLGTSWPRLQNSELLILTAIAILPAGAYTQVGIE